MRFIAALLVLATPVAEGSFLPCGPGLQRRVTRGVPRRDAHALRMSADLSGWLQKEAGISDKFVGAVLETCDNEMIGSVENLKTLDGAGMLDIIFKPVVAASIKAALGGAAAVSGGAGGDEAAALGASAVAMPMAEVKRLLMLNGQDTWGSDTSLRNRLDMFVQQSYQSTSAQWDAAARAWKAPVSVANPNVLG